MNKNTCLLLGSALLLIILPFTKGSPEDVQLVSFDREGGGRLRPNQYSLLRPFPVFKTRKYKKHPIYGENQLLIMFDRVLELSMCIVLATII